MIRLLVAVCFVLTACALRAPSSWPDRGPFVLVTNPDAFPMYVEVRDGMGRSWIWGKVNGGKAGCWRWPFIAADGTITARREGETTTVRFLPWETRDGKPVHFWRWTPGDSVRVGTEYCR